MKKQRNCNKTTQDQFYLSGSVLSETGLNLSCIVLQGGSWPKEPASMKSAHKDQETSKSGRSVLRVLMKKRLGTSSSNAQYISVYKSMAQPCLRIKALIS
ncbi:hypothetical protein [Pseudovibrio sp. POLY-S9]|uniref:hypothetical protein n=1 Tax=Pseudovibrio sp. POLY-S9 TaxID=1576596 RepID=UPI00137A3E6D|nr:hypothetical protein [Pseudovibrio sp. POLY-S9]